MPNFSQTEQSIRDLFVKGVKFNYDGIDYTVENDAVKPTVKSIGGECKTDVYFVATHSNERKEFKISVKQDNANFLENKINYDRAKELFGASTDEILKTSIQSVLSNFETQNLVYLSAGERTKEKVIKLGWKFELLNVSTGQLAGTVNLTHDQVLDVYSGSNLPQNKKDALINGTKVPNSGVANYMMVVNQKHNLSVDYCVENISKMEDYIALHPNIFFACKALNYRLTDDKWDGNRPLAVYVDWRFVNGKITASLNYNTPLQVKGDAVGNQVKAILRQLKIDKDNFYDITKYLDPSVKVYR